MLCRRQAGETQAGPQRSHRPPPAAAAAHSQPGDSPLRPVPAGTASRPPLNVGQQGGRPLGPRRAEQGPSARPGELDWRRLAAGSVPDAMQHRLGARQHCGTLGTELQRESPSSLGFLEAGDRAVAPPTAPAAGAFVLLHRQTTTPAGPTPHAHEEALARAGVPSGLISVIRTSLFARSQGEPAHSPLAVALKPAACVSPAPALPAASANQAPLLGQCRRPPSRLPARRRRRRRPGRSCRPSSRCLQWRQVGSLSLPSSMRWLCCGSLAQIGLLHERRAPRPTHTDSLLPIPNATPCFPFPCCSHRRERQEAGVCQVPLLARRLRALPRARLPPAGRPRRPAGRCAARRPAQSPASGEEQEAAQEPCSPVWQ